MNRVRIIGGQWKRRLVQFESVEGLRPTPDRVRETLFNWLMWEISQARVLDLCAGSGALGIEALSRGAAYCSFIEPHRKQALRLQHELQQLGATDTQYQVINSSAQQVKHLHLSEYNLLFLDPPYALNLWQTLAEHYSPLLAASAWIYVEADRDLHTLGLPEHWILQRQTRAGTVQCGLFQTSP
ncbi:MAG: 16S rRNA (guanine(966)-N(2))-methyltransferase RsmD [Pseudomonadota bacterium]|nr:16S rRNA (guanine(966)-N(2))-methyltransferase RsmD [Pseudomonadota bacterium]